MFFNRILIFCFVVTPAAFANAQTPPWPTEAPDALSADRSIERIVAFHHEIAGDKSVLMVATGARVNARIYRALIERPGFNR